jgi:uncharacterized protein (TIGR03083 family)
MPTTMTVEQHIGVVESTGTRFAELAAAAGWNARVPTCPAWDVRALVAHQTMVHRWATAVITEGDPAAVPTETTIRTSVDDLATYYDDGLGALLDALRSAPDDLSVMTFLNDAASPRAFWARRQAHELTMHTVDALAARLGRVPSTDEVGLDPSLAADGVDELLRGFYTRGRSKLYAGVDEWVVVEATDVGARWVVRIGETMTVDDGPVPDASAADRIIVLRGSAAALDLALWNRGDDVTGERADDLLRRWQSTNQVQ